MKLVTVAAAPIQLVQGVGFLLICYQMQMSDELYSGGPSICFKSQGECELGCGGCWCPNRNSGRIQDVVDSRDVADSQDLVESQDLADSQDVVV